MTRDELIAALERSRHVASISGMADELIAAGVTVDPLSKTVGEATAEAFLQAESFCNTHRGQAPKILLTFTSTDKALAAYRLVCEGSLDVLKILRNRIAAEIDRCVSDERESCVQDVQLFAGRYRGNLVHLIGPEIGAIANSIRNRK